MNKNKDVVIYKQFYLNGKSFKIRKYKNNNRLFYSASMTNKHRFLGIYKNPRQSTNVIKDFAELFKI